MRADVDCDDTNGKVKGSHHADRSRWWYGVLLSGFCIGFIASQLLYMQSHQHRAPSEHKHRRQLQHSVPPSELEQILQRVAPQREVLIAISNYNLIQQGMLTTWLEVGTVMQHAAHKMEPVLAGLECSLGMCATCKHTKHENFEDTAQQTLHCHAYKCSSVSCRW